MNPRKQKTPIDTFFEIFDKYPREYFVFLFFIIFFLAIIWKTFSYTVLNYSFYSNLAHEQQVWEVEVPVTRGTIYSAWNEMMKKGTVFSTSVDLNDLAVDPQIEGDKTKLALFLTNVVYKEICYLASSDDCYNDMLRFLKVLEIPDFEKTENYIKESILKEIQKRLSKNKVTSIRLKDEISPENEKRILSWGISWVYPSESGLYVNPEELVQKDLFAQKYVETYGGNVEDIKQAIRRRDLRYIPIFQKLSLLGYDDVSKYIEEEKIAMKQGVLKKEESISWFLILSPHAQRIYPERKVASQIIGFLDNAGKWFYGIEWYFDDILKGNSGEKTSKKDIRWRTIDPVSFGNDDVWALEGADIYTTIDRNIQKKVESILEAGVKEYGANKWSVVVMDPFTWKVISLANYPNYDPNSPWDVYEIKKVNYWEYPNPETDLLGRTVFVEDVERGEAFYYDGAKIFLRKATREEYLDYSKTKYIYKNSFWAAVYQNDTISSLYEPWSIMKAITVAIGIDTSEIRAYDIYNDVWKLKIGDFPISNVDDRCLGYNSFTHALIFSCNVWMVRIAQRIGKALMYKYFVDFGFDEETGISLQWEVSAKIDPYEKWPDSKLLTSSYGLWISVTPLQMAVAYSVIANGGIYMKPYIVDKIHFPDGKDVVYKPQAVRRVLKPSTSKTVTQMLVTSVNEGVAKRGGVEGYSVAWKTGTSQIVYRWKYEEGVGSTYGSFAGFAPAEDPKFVVIVKLERPRTNQYGWATSAYIFSKITKELLEYYSIPKKSKK